MKEILEKMENLSYVYQTVDCLYTLCKHQFFGSIIEESGVVFTQLTRAVEHNLENKYVEKVPSISKKRLSRKKFKRHLLRAEQRNASTQTLGSSFLDMVHSLRNSKYESVTAALLVFHKESFTPPSSFWVVTKSVRILRLCSSLL